MARGYDFITIRMPDATLVHKFKSICRIKGRPLGSVAADLITKYVEKELKDPKLSRAVSAAMQSVDAS